MQLDKILVVTGAGSGIGRQLTLQLLQKGAYVAGIDIDVAALKETSALAQTLAGRLACFPLDITVANQVSALPRKVIEHFGAVDGLINNAGIIQPFKGVGSLTDGEIERVINVNFYGTVNMTRAFLPHLISRPQAHIVNISSMGGFLSVPGQTVYGAAKAAVKIFTEGLYAELSGTSVGVTIVFPGAIATNITQNSGLGKPGASKTNSGLKPMPAEKAAAKILSGVEKNRFRIIVGADARILDLLYRLSPRYATGLIQRKMKRLVNLN